jgi:hypothetical protein
VMFVAVNRARHGILDDSGTIPCEEPGHTYKMQESLPALIPII